MLGERGAVLLVEGEASVRQAAHAVLSPRVDVVAAETLVEARRHWQARFWSVVLVGAVLPDGRGLEWIEELHAAGPAGTTFIVLGEADRALVNRSFVLGASYLCKPLQSSQLLRLARLAAVGSPYAAHVVESVGRFGERHGLTPKETQILQAHMRGASREAFLEERNISANTYKTQVKSVLRKTRAQSLADVRERLLRLLTSP